MVHVFLSLFAFSVYAAETILSPVPDTVLSSFGESPGKPTQSFGALQQKNTEAVLGIETEASASTETVSPTPSPSLTPSPSPTPMARKAVQKQITVALLGDSMTDTLGPDVPHLKSILTRTYPGTTFTMKNYGVGATNIEYGVTRITNAYSYLGNGVPSLVSQKPDVVVVESFGYNPFSFDEGALDKQWLLLAKVVDTLKSNIPGVKIVIAATIAPNAAVFGDGAPGVSFDPAGKQNKVTTIKKYLENAIKFAKSQGLPLADAYHPSLDGSGNGKLMYINPGDHIHYSDAGRALFGRKVADAIIGNRLLE